MLSAAVPKEGRRCQRVLTQLYLQIGDSVGYSAENSSFTTYLGSPVAQGDCEGKNTVMHQSKDERLNKTLTG